MDGKVMKFGIRRLFTSKTEPTMAQATAVAGYVKSD
jgi:nicotinic acid phosphoribosyltransferase